MRVYEASTLISAEFGGIRDLSRHLSLNLNVVLFLQRSERMQRIAEKVDKRQLRSDEASLKT